MIGLTFDFTWYNLFATLWSGLNLPPPVPVPLNNSITCFLSTFRSLCSKQKPHLLCDVCCVYVSFHFETSFFWTVDLPSPTAVSSRTRSVSESESSFNLPSSFSAPTFLKSIYQGSLGSLSSLADSGTLKRWEGILRGAAPTCIRPTCISRGQRGWVGEWAQTFYSWAFFCTSCLQAAFSSWWKFTTLYPFFFSFFSHPNWRNCLGHFTILMKCKWSLLFLHLHVNWSILHVKLFFYCIVS